MRSKLRLTLICLLLLLVLPHSILASDSDVLYIRLAGDMRELDPAHITDSTSTQIARLIYSQLVSYVPGTLEIVPEFAKSWEISGDGLEYTFFLRDDYYWHRGFGQVTAEDVAFSIERIRDGIGPAAGSRYRKDFELITEIDIIDPVTIKLYLSDPQPNLLDILAFRPGFIVCREAIDKYGENYISNAVGSGPYVLERWDRGTQILLIKHNHHNLADTMAINRVVGKIIRDDAVAEIAMRRGEVDIAYFEDYEPFSRLEGVEGVVTKSIPGTTPNWIHLKTTIEPFNDIRVRQALAHAICREELTLAVPSMTPLFSIVPELLFGHTSDIKIYEYNPEKAVELLAEAGYPDGLSFELMYYTHPVKIWNFVVPVIQEQWRRVGVSVVLWGAEWSAMDVRRSAGDYQAMVMQTGRMDPFQLIEPYFHSDYIPKPNNSYYYGIDEMIEEAKVTVDLEDRWRIIEDIQRKIAEDIPVIVLGNVPWMAAWRSDVEGMVPHFQKIVAAWEISKK